MCHWYLVLQALIVILLSHLPFLEVCVVCSPLLPFSAVHFFVLLLYISEAARTAGDIQGLRDGSSKMKDLAFIVVSGANFLFAFYL